jgi:hypothetical protein
MTHMTTHEMLMAHLSKAKEGAFSRLPMVRCANGFTMSVQYGSGLYCSQYMTDFPVEPKTCEVGFPSRCVKALEPYREGADKPTKSVYGWVPLAVIVEIIDANGGWE